MQNMTASDTNPLNFLKLKVRISRARKFRETVSDAVTRTNVSRNFVTVKQMTNAQTNRPKTPRRANVKSANYPPFEIAENAREPCRRCPGREPPEISTAPAGVEREGSEKDGTNPQNAAAVTGTGRAHHRRDHRTRGANHHGNADTRGRYRRPKSGAGTLILCKPHKRPAKPVTDHRREIAICTNGQPRTRAHRAHRLRTPAPRAKRRTAHVSASDGDIPSECYHGAS